jgi:hypothetical protein
MPRYKLRTLLILLAVLPPMIAGLVQYRHWRDDQLWLSHEAAKRERDERLIAWRKTFELVQSGRANAAQETAIQQRYYLARKKVQSARNAIESRYGKTDAELVRAMEARLARKNGR